MTQQLPLVEDMRSSREILTDVSNTVGSQSQGQSWAQDQLKGCMGSCSEHCFGDRRDQEETRNVETAVM